MSLQDPIADMLTRIRNGQKSSKLTVSMPSSKIKLAILSVLKEEGYISDYVAKNNSLNKSEVEVHLKYYKGRPVIEKLKRISKSSCRKYTSLSNLLPILNGFGTLIISTPKGIVTDKKARQLGLGGEVICEVA